ncbi:hypothetical protein Asp14428_01530 [Actinoplanes sp. NBRC 14428]|uniref:Carboxypeptidase regulatory-like domain-containing protein n=1 Tax=Pseudosporangium ferrugineum TaxID=439699 RepID=A0A2T0SIT9_9ACTN|nr:hypothetical protein [Pseudosporangium ferrugineum]PRY33322.1 hypothetical protein CLV70_101484 [Pseudosporangium ferrugineum]BCJ48678.1 hypothetical protein Asp14428_01530 [Actinoplanes sp. NBRC 14428]
MNDAIEPTDERLLTRLGELFGRADPPPADAVELARQSFVLRTLDADLAALVEDSEEATGDAAVHRQAMAVRDPGTAPQPRQLTFQVIGPHGRDEVVIAVQVESVGPRRRLTGHLAPQGPARIEVRQPAVPQPRRVDADGRGLFVIDDVLPGPMSLTCRRAGVAPVATQWTLV